MTRCLHLALRIQEQNRGGVRSQFRARKILQLEISFQSSLTTRTHCLVHGIHEIFLSSNVDTARISDSGIQIQNSIQIQARSAKL